MDTLQRDAQRRVPGERLHLRRRRARRANLGPRGLAVRRPVRGVGGAGSDGLREPRHRRRAAGRDRALHVPPPRGRRDPSDAATTPCSALGRSPAPRRSSSPSSARRGGTGCRARSASGLRPGVTWCGCETAGRPRRRRPTAATASVSWRPTPQRERIRPQSCATPGKIPVAPRCRAVSARRRSGSRRLASTGRSSLADVPAEDAGRVLKIRLFDPGEGGQRIRVLAPRARPRGRRCRSGGGTPRRTRRRRRMASTSAAAGSTVGRSSWPSIWRDTTRPPANAWWKIEYQYGGTGHRPDHLGCGRHRPGCLPGERSGRWTGRRIGHRRLVGPYRRSLAIDRPQRSRRSVPRPASTRFPSSPWACTRSSWYHPPAAGSNPVGWAGRA